MVWSAPIVSYLVFVSIKHLNWREQEGNEQDRKNVCKEKFYSFTHISPNLKVVFWRRFDLSTTGVSNNLALL